MMYEAIGSVVDVGRFERKQYRGLLKMIGRRGEAMTARKFKTATQAQAYARRLAARINRMAGRTQRGV